LGFEVGGRAWLVRVEEGHARLGPTLNIFSSDAFAVPVVSKPYDQSPAWPGSTFPW
jgi:hypothetical protein